MTTNLLKSSLLIAAVTSFIACAPKKAENSDTDAAVSIMSSNLKAVGDDFLPEAISDNGRPSATSAAVATKITQKAGDDICDGKDFMECQPRLIRAYLMFGRQAVALTQKIITDVSKNLAGAADNSSGVYNDDTQHLSVEYNKRSASDFDFLIRQNNVPVGRVTANPISYQIQFDLGVLDKDKPDTRGGKIDIQVKFTDSTHWQSQITATNQLCNVDKPDDPTNARIAVIRAGELWSGQSMFYNGIAGAFGVTKTCATQATDSTGLVIYTDFVSDRQAAKAAMYVMKRTETSTSQIGNFGFNNLCENYPDFCQALATSIGATPAFVDSHLNQLTNPYCVRRGSNDVAWNSNCQSISPTVAGTAFLNNTSWISPNEFYKFEVKIPEHL